jgi:hypothetical protein
VLGAFPEWGALPVTNVALRPLRGRRTDARIFTNSLAVDARSSACRARDVLTVMNPGAGSTSDYPGEVLAALATGLAADTIESGRRTLEVVRARSPELVLLSEDTGEDLVATSAGFIDMLLASLRSDLELPWAEYDERSRAYGRLRAAQ